MKKKLNSGGLTGSEKKYRALFDNAPIGISVVDVNRKILEANKALEKVISLSSEELTNELYKKRRYVRSDGSELPEDELPSTLSINRGTPVLDVEIGIESGQKIIAWTQVSAAPVDLPEKCAVVITQDITEKKRLQSELIDNEAKFRALFENSLDAFLISSPDGTIHSANSAACKMFGYGEVQLCKLGRSGLVDTSDPVISRVITDRNKTGMFFGEITMIRNGGIKFPVEISSSIFSNISGEQFASTVIRDITERKKVEKALVESEERLRMASKATGFGTYSYEFESGKGFYSDEFLALYGLIPGETLELDSDLVAKTLYPADKSLFLTKMREANNPRGSGILDIEFRIIRPDGELRWIKSKGQTVFTGNTEDDRPLHANGIIQDITERKKNEQNLYESGERYRLFMDNSGLGIGYYDTDGTILMFNKVALKSMGGTETDFVGKNLTDVFGTDKGNFFIERLRLAARSEIPLQFQDEIDLGGDPGWYLSTHMRILNKNGEVEGIQVIANNITQSKIAENTILESNANLNAIFENTKDMIASRDKKNCLIAFNTPFKDIIRKLYDIEAVPGLYTLTYLKKRDEKVWIRILNDVLKGKVHKSEFSWDFGNGDIRTYDISYQPIIKNGEIIGTLETNRDITESKKAEEKIRAGSLYVRSLIEASLDPLLTINADGKITDVNSSTEKITGVKRIKLIGSDFSDYFTNPDKARNGYRIVFSKGVVKDYPLTILHKSGRKTDVLYNATLFKNDKGVVQGVFAAARDITLRKKMEIKLKNSKRMLEKLNKHLNEVREKERTEIALNLHDDLGQRLTALCLDIAWVKSRIGVQSLPVRKKMAEMTREINETIDGIKELSSFLRPTILYDLGLVPAIISQLNKFENQSGIKCYFYFDSEEFNVDQKISLIFYRIIQESLTNIVRHSGASAMELSLKKLKNAIELVIKDDGVGIDNEKVNSLTSMGLVGIRERVKSCHGEVSIRGDKSSGTTIIVTIPIKKRGL